MAMHSWTAIENNNYIQQTLFVIIIIVTVKQAANNKYSQDQLGQRSDASYASRVHTSLEHELHRDMGRTTQIHAWMQQGKHG